MQLPSIEIAGSFAEIGSADLTRGR